jgi:biotin transporter BioY
VPITGQTFAVLLIGAVLGSRRGALSILLYLGWGAMGLPVFSGGGGGIATLAGPTGGYLAGFVPAAFLVGWLCERGWDRSLWTAGLAMVLGNIVIYFFGLLWLAGFVGWDQVVALGLAPFILGDVLKIILAALALPGGWALIERLK